MILTPEQFAEHNKKLLAEKEDISSKEESKWLEKWVEKVIAFFQDMEDVKEDIEELETELENKSNIEHTHKEFQELNEKIEEKSKLLNNLSDEIKNTKSSIKHYDDKPVLEQLKAIDEKVNWIVIPEVDLSGFLKEKDIETLANKNDVYTKEEIKSNFYTKKEVYTKDETYSKKEVYSKVELENRLNILPKQDRRNGGASDINDDQTTSSNTWSAQKIQQELSNAWSWSRLLDLVWQNCSITYNWSNQVLTETYADGTVTTYTYSWGVIQTTVTVFPDAETITATYTYTWSLVTWVTYT